MFTHCDSHRVSHSLSVILRLTHISSQRRPPAVCVSCRPLTLVSFPLPPAAFWCSSSSAVDWLPSCLHLPGFYLQRDRATSNYLISSAAPRVICRSLCYSRFCTGLQVHSGSGNLGKYTFWAVVLSGSEMCPAVTLSPSRRPVTQPVRRRSLPFMSSNLPRAARVRSQWSRSRRRKVSLRLQ